MQIGTIGNAQDDLPNCQGFTNSQILNVYQSHETLLATGRKTNTSEQEAMVTLIYKFSRSAITQMCIDTWYDMDTNGEVYAYNRFKNRYGYISKEAYWKNRYELEILSIIHQIIIEG